MRKNYYISLFALFICFISANATDYQYDAASLSILDQSGCVQTTYTFKQKTVNDNGARHTTSDVCIITFPAGTDATTFTGGTWSGTAIVGAVTTATTISFTIPKAVGKKRSFDIVLNGITNGTSINSTASVEATNTSGDETISNGDIDYFYNYPVETFSCPTCSDGIQNGNETGIDCGDTCNACPTCVDGIMNGTETGIDCGGTCGTCPTCSDGIMNGAETGIDCGGVCAACPTCVDGIQNGTETGIDCGGGCPVDPCPTCVDGIQNGGETGVDCGGPDCPACPESSDLFNVVMTNSGIGVNLLSDMITNSSGTVNLTTGLIITNTYEVKVQNPSVAAVTNHNVSSYVYGNLKRLINTTGSYDFPVGNLTHVYQLSNINFTGATEITNLVARFDDWSPLASPLNEVECSYIYGYDPLDNGFWTIKADTLDSTGVYTATMYNTNYTNYISDTLTVMRDGGSGWALRNGDSCALNSPDSVIRTGLSGFSLFANAQGGSLVTLSNDYLKFYGQSHIDYNHLSWTSGNEDVDFFEVLRSENGNSFYPIGKVSSDAKQFYYNDENTSHDAHYYRLKQIDKSGKLSYSNIIKLDSKLIDDNINIYPNPSSGSINISYLITSPTNTVSELLIYNSLGSLVMSENLSVEQGSHTKHVDLSNYSSDLYFINLRINESLHTRKLILQNK